MTFIHFGAWMACWRHLSGDPWAVPMNNCKSGATPIARRHPSKAEVQRQ
jgi:hypothetical protein